MVGGFLKYTHKYNDPGIYLKMRWGILRELC